MSSRKDVLFKECINSLAKIEELSDVSESLKQNQQKLGVEIQKYYRVENGKIVIDIDSQTLENIITNNMEEVVEIFENNYKNKEGD